MSEEKIKVRIAGPEDAAALVEFNRAMALETEGKRLDREIVQKGVEAVFRDREKGFYVAAEDAEGRIVGGLLITFEWSDWRDGWFWWIQSVFLLPAYRGRGIYRRLYEFVKKKAAERGGVCGFRLYVERENERARKVYQRVGMERTDYLLYEEEI